MKLEDKTDLFVSEISELRFAHRRNILASDENVARVRFT